MASRFRRRVVTILLVGYAALVMVITMSPRMPGSSTVARLVDRVLASLHHRGLFTGVEFLHVEFLGNVLMFVPLGVFTALLLSRRHWWILLFSGTFFSGVIELTQMLFLPGRFPEVRDLASNTIGFLLGALAALLFRHLIAHRDGLVERDRKIAEERSAHALQDPYHRY